jgi:hypothetical protein
MKNILTTRGKTPKDECSASLYFGAGLVEGADFACGVVCGAALAGGYIGGDF